MNNELRYTVICNGDRKEFFFSTDHCQRLNPKTTAVLTDHWVPVSGTLPMSVVARPSLPDGIIDTIEKYIMIFHDDEKEIANPDPKFQPSYRSAPTVDVGSKRYDDGTMDEWK